MKNLASKFGEPCGSRTHDHLIKSLSIALFSIVFEANLLFCAYRYFVRKTPILLFELKTIKGAVRRCARIFKTNKFELFTYNNFYDNKTFSKLSNWDLINEI